MNAVKSKKNEKDAEILEISVSSPEDEGPTKDQKFFERELQRFADVLERRPEEAYHKFGLSFFPSLPPEVAGKEMFRLRKRSTDPCDLYNKGVLELGQEKVEKAAKHFQKAMAGLSSLDPDSAKAYIEDCPSLLPSLAFNLYLCKNELSNKSEAKKAWKSVVKIAKNLFLEHEMGAMWEMFEEMEQEL